MEITVKMSEAEFMQFMAYRDDKAINEREAARATLEVCEQLRSLAHTVLMAVEPAGEHRRNFTITNHERLKRAYQMAEEVFA